MTDKLLGVRQFLAHAATIYNKKLVDSDTIKESLKILLESVEEKRHPQKKSTNNKKSPIKTTERSLKRSASSTKLNITNSPQIKRSKRFSNMNVGDRRKSTSRSIGNVVQKRKGRRSAVN